MPLITVGVPAYNEAELLAGSLEVLTQQTFSDFEVLIFDNASTDATAEIAASLAARDPRFKHIRQPFNKGEFLNFHDAVKAATSPYFLWRACDDRSAPNYLEELVRLLEQNPDKDLAVGGVRVVDLDGRMLREFDYPALQSTPSFWRRWSRILNARAGWYYGLYRRDAILDRMNEVVRDYRNLWGFDYLVILGFLLDDKVVGTNATFFQQTRKRTAETQRKKRTNEERDRLIFLRQRFYEVACAMFAQREPSRLLQLLAKPLLFEYTGRKLFGFRRVAWRMMTRAPGTGALQRDDLPAQP